MPEGIIKKIGNQFVLLKYLNNVIILVGTFDRIASKNELNLSVLHVIMSLLFYKYIYNLVYLTYYLNKNNQTHK